MNELADVGYRCVNLKGGIFFAIILLMMMPRNMAADNLPYLADGVIDTTCHETLGLQRNEAVRTVNIFTATDHTDHYANGVVMTAFKGKLYCMWQSSPKDEDSDDTWVAYSISADEGLTWSAPKPLSLPSEEFYCTSGGWLVSGDTLTAFIDTWQKELEPRGGRTCYMTTTDGLTWSQLQPVRMADGLPMEGVLEQDPYTLPDGRMIGATHFMPGLHICPVFTDDPTGHNGWQKAAFLSEDTGKQSREIEPSQYVQPNGTIVMLFRDQKSTFRKLASVSPDRGETWSKPQITPMALPIWSAVLQTANGVGLWSYSLVRMVSDSIKPFCSAVVRLMTCLPDATMVDTKPWVSTIPRLSYIIIAYMSVIPSTRKMCNAR